MTIGADNWEDNWLGSLGRFLLMVKEEEEEDEGRRKSQKRAEGERGEKEREKKRKRERERERETKEGERKTGLALCVVGCCFQCLLLCPFVTLCV